MRDTCADARVLAVALAASLVAISAAAPLVAAAGQTTVSLDSGDGTVDVGETTTVEVVVNDVQGGVGAAGFRVVVANTSVVRITNVTVLGSGTVTKEVAENGSWADVEYVFRDTADTGSVVVAEVTVEGVGAGTTELSLEPAEDKDDVAVFDESGTGYEVTGTSGTRISTDAGEATASDPGTPGSGSADATGSDTAAGNADTSGTDDVGTADADASAADDSSANGAIVAFDSVPVLPLAVGVVIGLAATAGLVGLYVGRRFS